MDEAGTRAGGPESQELADALNLPVYGMEAVMAGTPYWKHAEAADAGSAQGVDEADTEEVQQQQQQARRRQNMLPRLSLCPGHSRQHGFEGRLRGAEAVAKLLRQRLTLPAEIEKEGNWQHEAVLLPRVSCAFEICSTDLTHAFETTAKSDPIASNSCHVTS